MQKMGFLKLPWISDVSHELAVGNSPYCKNLVFARQNTTRVVGHKFSSCPLNFIWGNFPWDKHGRVDEHMWPVLDAEYF